MRRFTAEIPLLLACIAPAVAQTAESRAIVQPVSVPFVGCPADGMAGPVEAPEGTSMVVLLSHRDAGRLAYYSQDGETGVFAPRGWHCILLYGSSGTALYLSPLASELPKLGDSALDGISGPAIQAQWRSGDTSGRDSVAEVIALVFPTRRKFVREVLEMYGHPESTFRYGPYSTDRLAYRGETVVEYETPAETEGLGTKSWLKKGDRPIQGVAILAGKTPDLLHLAVRLPADLAGLAPVIVRQFENEAAQAARK